ncbi:MAG: small ribosomal subunit Rsm22 family protein [Desulfovibrionaceae bacterium]|nr:small ribosomal subunit Rsm22 family protein [Desulfovibrionaceae bacterium]
MNELFTPPNKDAIDALEELYAPIRKVMPLKKNQYALLPRSIQELSYILTQQRGEMPFYWSSPRLRSAYFYYFMPWNLVRLAQCIPNLYLPELSYIEEYPSILDIGSGPLTLPLALWLFRKDLRDIPLTIYCYDTAKHPMEYGKRLLEEIMSTKKWKIVLIDARKTHYRDIKTKVALTIASNVINELVQRKTRSMEESLTNVYTMLTYHLAHKSHALCIEIGTRLGGTIISALHDIIVEAEEYDIIAPCTHNNVCPYSEGKQKTWCHFSFADFVAPTWLTKLSTRADLPKTTLSTSLLHIGNGIENTYNSRILSSPIYIPSTKEYIRYVCREEGIGVLEKAKRYVQGTALNTQISIPQRIDEKTGCPFVSLVKEK